MSRFYSEKLGSHHLVSQSYYWRTYPQGRMIPLSEVEAAFVVEIDDLPYSNITAQRALRVLDKVEGEVG